MNQTIGHRQISPKHISRLKFAGILLTLFGIGLFAYFVYAVGVHDIFEGVKRFGFAGFVVIIGIFFVRIFVRAYAWKLSVHAPYALSLKDTIPAVVIGEAMSTTVPLGFLASGTAKAIAVRNRVPLVVGLSSIATENLFYSFITAIFLISGGVVLLRGFAIDESLAILIDILIITFSILLILGILMVVRQWHFASKTCEWIYSKGFFPNLLKSGRSDIRLFEDLIYGFYRHYPRRFGPICLLETVYFVGGVAEVWFILSRIDDALPGILDSFVLESVSRFIAVMFKLVPLVIGVDEAGSQFIGQTLALTAGIGVTIAIIRKGRILFWTAIGISLIIKRGLSISDISEGDEV